MSAECSITSVAFQRQSGCRRPIDGAAAAAWCAAQLRLEPRGGRSGRGLCESGRMQSQVGSSPWALPRQCAAAWPVTPAPSAARGLRCRAAAVVPAAARAAGGPTAAAAAIAAAGRLGDESASKGQEAGGRPGSPSVPWRGAATAAGARSEGPAAAGSDSSIPSITTTNATTSSRSRSRSPSLSQGSSSTSSSTSSIRKPLKGPAAVDTLPPAGGALIGVDDTPPQVAALLGRIREHRVRVAEQMKQRYLDRYPSIKEERAAQRAAKAEARRLQEEAILAGRVAVREAARSSELQRVQAALAASDLPEGVKDALLASMKRRRLGMTAIIGSLPSVGALVEQYGAQTVQRWLARSPFVLSALETVPARLSTLASLAGISYEEALALSTRCPIVIGVKPEVMRVRYHELKEVLDMSHEDMRVMIQATPVLLAMSTPNIATKWRRLKALSQTRDEWRASMEGFHPATLGIQLTYSMDRFARIEFLAEQAARITSARESGDSGGDSDSIYLRKGFSSILGLSAAAFDQQYPTFREWLERREALGQRSKD